MLKIALIAPESISVQIREILNTQIQNKDFSIVSFNNLQDGIYYVKINCPELLIIHPAMHNQDVKNALRYFAEVLPYVIIIGLPSTIEIAGNNQVRLDFVPDLKKQSVLLSKVKEILLLNEISKRSELNSVANRNMDKNGRILKKIALKTAENVFLVDVKDVMYCQADRNYTSFYLFDKSRIVVSKSLREYEQYFAPYDFFRIHQSYLLNPNYIKRFDKTSSGLVILKDNTALPVASRKKESFLVFLSNL